jgi:NhaA family Na+:H+ antiporter
LPEDIEWRHLALLGCVGGVGFTMSLFIVNLAFPEARLLATGKCAVLLASVLAAVVSFSVGRCVRPRNQ